jgi:THO complex subunit 1
MDFLISLSAKAKEKLANIKVPNKSVMYQEQILSEEDVSTYGNDNSL